MTTTHILETAGADIAYDVRGPLPTADGRPPLFMIGQPMDAGGFDTLASHFADRTVVTDDPRGLGRSVRKDGRVDHAPTVQADDVHGVIRQQATVFPSHHGGFLGGEFGYAGQPEAFARRLREVLDQD
jgi:hypothetical protein